MCLAISSLWGFFVTIKALFSYCGMEVFLPITTQQTLTVIPRWNSPIVSLRLSNEETGIADIFTIPITTYDNGYLSMDFAYDFTEGGRYVLELKDNAGKLLWRGKAISTDQDPQTYKMNADIIQL